jgi:hypothetical protein
MARVEIASQAWGYVIDRRGRPKANGLCAIDTTVFAASAGATEIAAPDFKSDDEGFLPGFVEQGTYTFVEADGDVRQVEAARGDSAVGEPGPAGPTGVPGDALGVLGVDVWNSQVDPEAVTDWSPIIEAIVGDGETNLLLRELLPCTTQLNLENTDGLIFQGDIPGLHPLTSASVPTSGLLWKGSTGLFINADGSDSLTLKNMGIVYDHASYNGDLIRGGIGVSSQAAAGLIEECVLGSVSGGMGQTLTARCLLNLRSWVGFTARKNAFVGAQHAIRGFDTTPGSENPDDITIEGNRFVELELAPLCNIGNHWRIHDNQFYMGSVGFLGTPTEAATDSDLTCTSSFTFERNNFWDFGDPANQHALHQKVANTWNARIRDNFIHGANFGASAQFLFDGPSALLIVEGNDFQSTVPSQSSKVIDLGSSATALKESVRITDNKWFTASSGSDGIANLGGHENVIVERNGDGRANHFKTLEGIDRLGLQPQFAPGIAASAGQTNISEVGIVGTDRAGYLWVTTTGGGASQAGKLADITFGTPTVPAPSGRASEAKIALVRISPYERSGFTGNHDTAHDCKPYVTVTDSSTTGWSLGVAVAVPASKRIVFAYEAVSL